MENPTRAKSLGIRCKWTAIKQRSQQLNQLSYYTFFLDCAVKQYFISLSSLPRLDFVPSYCVRRLLFWFLFDILIHLVHILQRFFFGCALKHIVTLWICGRNFASLRRIKRCLLEVWSVLSVQPTMREINLQVALKVTEWMVDKTGGRLTFRE